MRRIFVAKKIPFGVFASPATCLDPGFFPVEQGASNTLEKCSDFMKDVYFLIFLINNDNITGRERNDRIWYFFSVEAAALMPD